VIREPLDFSGGDRVITVRSRSGRPLVQVPAGTGLAALVGAVLLAPRATAVAAAGAMLNGISLSIDRAVPAAPAEAA
jgi:hypothetical protein